jgi:flavin-dependent dehydrogenase
VHKDQPRDQDVAVVGASVTGVFTAYLLSRAGCRVRLFEGASQLDPRPRTLIVTHRMRELLGNQAESAVVNEIRRFELFADGRAATIELDRPDVVIERTKLIRALGEAAQEAGAEVLLGRRFMSLREEGRRLVLTMERNEGGEAEEARVGTVVGADGVSSRVARLGGWPKQRTVPLVQAIVRLPGDMRPDTTRVWFIPEDTRYFYWLIPGSATEGALGLIGEEGPETRPALERFLERQGLTPLEFQAARIPLYTRWIPIRRRLQGGDVYLVGDAAGHVKVTTVGGIVSGLRGALGVAEAILNGGPSRRLRALRRELYLHWLVRRVMHRFSQADYSALVDLLNGSVRRDLRQYTRDEPGSLLWRLSVHQPRLLLLVLRALMGRGNGPRRPIPGTH